MSRGPGVWQRLLLDALEGVEAVNTSSAPYAMTPAPTRSDFVAVRRAARRLAETGQVRAIYRYLPTRDESRFTPQLVVTRLDSQLQGNAVPRQGAPQWVTPADANQAVLSTRVMASVLGVSPSTISRDARARQDSD